MQVDGAYAQQAPATLGPRHVDGVAHATVAQPAGAAHVHATPPGQVELPRGGQPGTQLAALVARLEEGELLHGEGVEDPPWWRTGVSALSVHQELHCSFLKGFSLNRLL